MATFTFELVSPERMLFSGPVDSVVVPGADGEFQVFAGHAPVMSTLEPGVVTVASAEGTRRLYVRGGFADVGPSSLTILAEQAIDIADLKPEEIARELKNAEEDLADAKTDDARAKAARKVEALRGLQRAATH